VYKVAHYKFFFLVVFEAFILISVAFSLDIIEKFDLQKKTIDFLFQQNANHNAQGFFFTFKV